MKTSTEYDFLSDRVAYSNKVWISENPTATLMDLHEFLEASWQELSIYDEDVLLCKVVADLGLAADYLNEWDPTDEPLTVGDRLANAEEDAGRVEELIELVGDSFPVSELPPQEIPSSMAG